uniref:Uncharacterized protein n=1 Tax=Heliothis virescens TaxID=7102 RepID=A0A2A4J5C6_HELVI
MITDDNQSGLFECSDGKSPISSVGGTSNPKSMENYSVFNEGSCGEPLFAQHIVVDFTPNDETDNDFLQKKICSFWKFIDNNPDIQNLKVKPDKMVYRDESSTNIMTETPNVEPESSIAANSEIYKTAVDMLVYAEDKNYIDRLFDAKMPMSNCTLGSREYKEGQLLSRPKKKDKKKPACTCKIDSTTCRVHCNQNKKNTSESPIRLLSRKMNEWDAKHPKSMVPPGQAPALQHCVIERTNVPDPF